MKKDFFVHKTLCIFLAAFIFNSSTFAETVIEAKSRVNWITRDFITDISYDTVKANLQMPSGKKNASMQLKTKMPQLIQPPLFSLFTDSQYKVSDMVLSNQLTFDQVNHFIMNGYRTPDVFSKDLITLQTTNTTNLISLQKLLIKHKSAYSPLPQVDEIFSRPYSGIIIDARGKRAVHGEYVKSQTYPCFFPKIWDENMETLFEKNMVRPEIVKDTGVVSYHYSNDLSDYIDRVGSDPLYIEAIQVYGRNRCDPVITRNDALRILNIPENVQLLKEGKVVILLDKENLIYDISTPLKDESYYVDFQTVKQYLYERKQLDIDFSDGEDGLKFEVNLRFYPDSEELLPSEKERIEAIANVLKDILKNNGYTILVEGHTADVGKPVGQLNLSIDRTRTVMNALINEGLDKGLFSYKGFGGTDPVAPNNTEEGRAQNRRVVITARPRATYIQKDW